MAVKQNGSALYTLDEFSRLYESEDIQVHKFFLKQVFNTDGTSGKKIVVCENSLIDKYLAEISANKQKVQFSTSEYHKYRYNPKLLSYDLYGTTELWFLILRANELYTAAQFDLKTLYLYDSAILAKMARLIDIEQPFIDINIDEIDTQLAQ